jgi:hypothetical protein
MKKTVSKKFLPTPRVEPATLQGYVKKMPVSGKMPMVMPMPMPIF